MHKDTIIQPEYERHHDTIMAQITETGLRQCKQDSNSSNLSNVSDKEFQLNIA